MSDATLNLSPMVYEYLIKHSLREPAVLAELRKETRKLTESSMQISPEQGQLMALLMEILDAKKTLDIGTFTGYSALAVALALPADGKVYALDVSDHWTNVAKKFWQDSGAGNKIELRLGPARETLSKMIDDGQSGTFDFAFIDADKANYSQYYELALQLLRKGGVIAVDNVLWDGAVADPDNQEESTKAIRALNAKILKDDRVTISMLPIGDGLTLARKR
ncbi:MAG TPA: class I SAM-dependent methyltransferase [Gammaproteobacteria bacterium]|nr:class I SAM-dependent methyltransferase [Gammaproteobacteria bacterium]